jgi:acetolactate synthase-1/2/3 large subunit
MPGMHGSYAANMGMTETDLLIALGSRFDDRVTGRLAAFAPHAKVIHVDIDPAEVGKIRTPDVPIVGDVKKVIQKILEELEATAPQMKSKNATARAAWWGQIKEWQSQHPLEPVFSTDEIKPQHLMAEIDRLSGGEAIVCSDVGQHQMWAAQLIKFNPDKLVFAICGDGGFQMSIPELATIANQGLPVKIIVMNNGYLGMVRQWQELFYNNRLCQVQLDTFPDPEKLAGAYGFPGRTVTRPSQLRQALEEAVKEPGPYLLNVQVTPFENVYPMVPAGGAVNEMVLGPPQPVEVA